MNPFITLAVVILDDVFKNPLIAVFVIAVMNPLTSVTDILRDIAVKPDIFIFIDISPAQT